MSDELDADAHSPFNTRHYWGDIHIYEGCNIYGAILLNVIPMTAGEWLACFRSRAMSGLAPVCKWPYCTP